MLIYPQLGTGALAQYPIRKRRQARTVANTAADGSSIRLADPAGEITEWTLDYTELTDEELAAIERFFAAAEGTLNAFTFVDPTANLLAWSGNSDAAEWEKDPLLSLAPGIADPTGGTQGWRLSNSGAAAQTLCQTVMAPGAYLYCLSVYVRASEPLTATLLLGEARAERAVATEWSRIALAGSGEAAAESVRFGLEIPAGTQVDAFGMQVEPQAGPSKYRASTRDGVFAGARLGDDELRITSHGVNRHACRVRVVHAAHI